MTPELNKVYQGDCVEIMRGWPDKCVDLIITDPPYGMEYKSNHYKGENPHEKIAGDDHFPVEVLAQSRVAAEMAQGKLF